MHIGGGGIVSWLGPVELWLGIAAAKLERSDTAGFAVQARVELAEALIGRGRDGDDDAVVSVILAARPAAGLLGMVPFRARIDSLLVRSGRPGDQGPLSARELEVAALVATGCTNREIAKQLYISERTAGNHVQHILTKLGFDNRTQIATWHHGRPG